MRSTIKAFCRTLSILIITSFVAAFIPVNFAHSGSIEETADMTLPGDNIVTGHMDTYSKNSIIVENIRYMFCGDLLVFSPHNTMMSVDDMDAAKEVKLFVSSHCVRKIKVLSIAE